MIATLNIFGKGNWSTKITSLLISGDWAEYDESNYDSAPGKNKWIMYMMNFMTLVFFALFIYCVIQFFDVETTKELLKWGIGSVVFLFGVSMLKIFAWMQMDRKALIRELKRLELQISSLASKN